MASSRTVPKAVLRWIRANPKYGIHALWAERLFKFAMADSISNPPDGSSFMHWGQPWEGSTRPWPSAASVS